MMKKALLLFLFSISVNIHANEVESDLVGMWKSSEEKTLESMRSVEGITSKAKDFFENNFFGKLISEYRDTEVRSYFDNEKDAYEGMMKFKPYKLMKENEHVFVIEAFDELEGRVVTKVLGREGNCYYMLVSKWEFREYFCKISK